MGRVLDAITDELAAFIAAQRVFFVATAPTDGGHVNLTKWAERRGPDGLVEYREERNAVSIDGLPGLVADGR
jgi:predicted pyridoxine 5'-phosphate oxidase superfamily flavin-nucleotide-binding protein